MAKNVVNQFTNPVSMPDVQQLNINLMLSVINTHQMTALGEPYVTAAAIDSASYYNFFYKDFETYHYQPLDHINGQGFW